LHNKKEITKNSCKTKKEKNKHIENLNIKKEKDDMWKKLLHTIIVIIMSNSNDAREAKM
jgi:hypothetical protein